MGVLGYAQTSIEYGARVLPLSKLITLDPSAPVEREAIAPEKVVEGAPVTETRNQYAFGDHTFVGEWSAGVGAWRISYTEWEFCEITRGLCELVPDGGEARRYGVGDAFVIEPGFVGVWRVIEPMTKRYVIRL